MKYLYLCNTFARLMLQNIVLTLIQYTYFKVVFLGYIRFLGYICGDGGRVSEYGCMQIRIATCRHPRRKTRVCRA